MSDMRWVRAVLDNTPRLLKSYFAACLLAAKLVDSLRREDVLNALDGHEDVLGLVFDLDTALRDAIESQREFIQRYEEADDE